MKKIEVKILNKSKYPLPCYQSLGAAGLDLRADINENLLLLPQKIHCIPTGLFLEIPVGTEAQIRARSGLALNHGLSLVNGIGTIDSDYRGEIKIIMINLIDKPYALKPGERVAQMVFCEYTRADFLEVTTIQSLSKSQRGDGGFGHSGK